MYGIDAEQRVVGIQSLEGAVTYRAGVLCRRHADAMVVPLGWMLDDLDFSNPADPKQKFFRAEMKAGVINLESAEVRG